MVLGMVLISVAMVLGMVLISVAMVLVSWDTVIPIQH